MIKKKKKNHVWCLSNYKNLISQKSPGFQLFDTPGMQTLACMGAESKTHVNDSGCYETMKKMQDDSNFKNRFILS